MRCNPSARAIPILPGPSGPLGTPGNSIITAGIAGTLGGGSRRKRFVFIQIRTARQMARIQPGRVASGNRKGSNLLGFLALFGKEAEATGCWFFSNPYGGQTVSAPLGPSLLTLFT